MPRSDWFRPTFRLKLLIALIGTIAPLLLVTVLVVRREADRQVDIIVQSAARRAGDLFGRIEAIREQQLNQIGYRFSNSNRWGAAVQQALEGDTAFLVQNTIYELEFAGYPAALAAVTDLSGSPIIALVNGKRLPDPSVAISKSALDRVFKGDTAVFGYHLIGTQLFSIHPIAVNLVTEPIGIMLLGFAIDDQTAHSLGEALHANVCFMAKGKCAATANDVIANQFATVSSRLPGASEAGVQIRLRVPLDDVIRPFTKILHAIEYIGIAVLLLAIIIALILSRSFARPVQALVTATARVARGDYDTHVHVTTHDEIGTLAEAFNDMTRGLLLKEKYRGVLDKVVSSEVAEEMLKGEIQLGGEARETTTLFADVRGFTAMSEAMQPHEVIELLNEVMEHAEAAVVAEGGVVDKYVGDEIMALFGAPMSRADDAIRAIRAAVRIQQELARINETRLPAGKPPITMGIGVSTGTVVAGNMGSARRLNYTVLGAPVNLAARLCSEAEGGQILISQETLAQVREHVHAAPLGARVVKGFSRPVDVFEVIALEASGVAATSRISALTAVLFALSLSHALPAHAQRTLNVGSLQVQASGRVDAEVFVPDSSPSWLVPTTRTFAAGRASAYLDFFAGRHWYGFAELRADRGEAPSEGDLQGRIEQAFVRVTPFSGNDASLQVGRFVSPFGGYPQRHHSTSDPLIRPPLSYDYRTMVCASLVPFTNDGWLDWKEKPAFFRPRGAPPVWSAPYQLGAMLVGSAGRLSYRVAAMNGAPSSEPHYWNLWPRSTSWLSWAGNVGMQLTPELRVGASYSSGTYLPPAAQSKLPAGNAFYEYKQKLLGLEATATRGLVELRGEFLHDYWRVPRVTDGALDDSWYVEGKLKVAAGAFVAGRVSAIRFNRMHYGDGTTTPWDYDARRIQFGAGYRISEALELRSELMLNHTSGPIDPRDNLFSVQASWLLN